jgi:hypothetical protein
VGANDNEVRRQLYYCGEMEMKMEMDVTDETKQDLADLASFEATEY